jgi:hypothetical protein
MQITVLGAFLAGAIAFLLYGSLPPGSAPLKPEQLSLAPGSTVPALGALAQECASQYLCGQRDLPESSRVDVSLRELLETVQSALKRLEGGASHNSQKDMGLMSTGLLDGLEGKQGLFVALGLGEDILEDSDYLICKSKDFYGSFFQQEWKAGSAAAANLYHKQQRSSFDKALPLRRCLQNNTLPGNKRSPECFRVSNQSFDDENCTDGAPCELPSAQSDALCDAPRGGVCGQGRCYNVYTMTDMGIAACVAWRAASQDLKAWPPGGGLESLALYARQAVFSLLLAHAALLAGVISVEALKADVSLHAAWVAGRLEPYADKRTHLDIVVTTSTRGFANPSDYVHSSENMFSLTKWYDHCGKVPPATNANGQRVYRHFIRIGCMQRGRAYPDAPRLAIVGYAQASDQQSWCQGAVNCTIVADPAPYTCQGYTIWPFMAELGSGSYGSGPTVCQANFPGLQPNGWKNECALGIPTGACDTLREECQTYLDLLWSEQTGKAAERLSEALGTLLAHYHAVAAIFTALSEEPYAHITGFAQGQNWLP